MFHLHSLPHVECTAVGFFLYLYAHLPYMLQCGLPVVCALKIKVDVAAFPEQRIFVKPGYALSFLEDRIQSFFLERGAESLQCSVHFFVSPFDGIRFGGPLQQQCLGRKQIVRQAAQSLECQSGNRLLSGHPEYMLPLRCRKRKKIQVVRAAFP